ncbi:MAG: CBS domain-containing protein, partial [Streptococcus sanguinis]|nr:CBS domain-containing protein [Streptococcus sanguinis]
CYKDMNILEAAAVLQDFAIDSLPVVDKNNERKILGTVTKSALLDYIIQEARSAEVNR